MYTSMILTLDSQYQELRDKWVPEDAHICAEIWMEAEETAVVVYLDFESRMCQTLRFFPIGGKWNVSVERSISFGD